MHCPTHHGRDHKAEEIHFGDARGNRGDLEGDRRERLDDDDPHTPISDQPLKCRELVLVMIELDHRLTDQGPQPVADDVADDRSQGGAGEADREKEPQPFRPQQRHRHEQQIGRDWQKRAVGEGDGEQRPWAQAVMGQRRDMPQPAAAHYRCLHVHRYLSEPAEPAARQYMHPSIAGM